MLIVNCSSPYYNLGAHKLADWLIGTGEDVSYFDGDPGMFGGQHDKVYLSVIFSWHAPIALQIAMRYKTHADIECGGPGMFALAHWWKQQTGMDVHRGIDQRFDHQRGNYKMTFASRGCPVGCSFCIVPRIEGLEFTIDWDFQPAPILCDNNLSALPVEFQNHIINRYQAAGVPLKDANSGFEPLTFDADTFARWRPILRGPWRFAFDTTSEEPQVRRMMQVLRDVPPKRKQVYVLIGNEPIQACYERCAKVIDWGGEPYVQPVMPLNALSRNDLRVAYDWTWQALKDFQRYYNRHLWRYFPLWEYSNRVGDKPIFRLSDHKLVIDSGQLLIYNR